MTDRIPAKGFISGGDAVGMGEFAPGDTVPVAHGGTGVTTLSELRTVLDVPSNAEVVSLLHAVNLIDNSNFSINQRGVSGTVTLAAGVYGHDRWKAGSGGAVYTFATAAGITTVTISSGSLVQVIDGKNLETATYTLSQTGTAQMRVVGGSYSGSPVSISVTGGTNLSIEVGVGTLKQVQLEKGSATTYRTPRYFDDEGRCFSCFYRMPVGSAGLGQAIGASTVYHSIRFPARMRAVPTVAAVGITAAASTGAAIVVNTVAIAAGSNVDGLNLNYGMASASFTAGDAALVTVTTAIDFIADF